VLLKQQQQHFTHMSATQLLLSMLRFSGPQGPCMESLGANLLEITTVEGPSSRCNKAVGNNANHQARPARCLGPQLGHPGVAPWFSNHCRRSSGSSSNGAKQGHQQRKCSSSPRQRAASATATSLSCNGNPLSPPDHQPWCSTTSSSNCSCSLCPHTHTTTAAIWQPIDDHTVP
jgi:hypothetical protein